MFKHRCQRVVPLASTLALASGLVSAQTISPLIQEGDTVAGVGDVTSIANLAINSAGQWIVEVDTDNADTNIDGALVKDGALFLQEAEALTAPAGATIGSFDTVNLNEAGQSGWNFFLDGTTGSSDNSGIYLDTTLVLQEGSSSIAPGFSAGTPYIGFFEAKINDADQILVLASVDDAAITSTVDRALVVFNLDTSGVLVSEAIIVKEGDVLSGQTEQVDDLETGPHNFDFNENGDALYIVDLSGDTTADHAVYLNTTLLAQEGAASPLAARNWEFLANAEVALNDGGDTVISGDLDGDSATDAVIVKNGAKFVQEGDALDAVAPETIASFGTGPVLISNKGNVLWFSSLSGDASMNEALWLDDCLLARTGVTQINGLTLTDIAGIQDGYTLSANGRYVVFEGTLSDGTSGAYQIELGPGGAVSRNGSGTNTVCLTSSSDPNLGEDWITVMDASAHAGATATVIVAYDMSLAGTPTPFGELLVAPEPFGGVLLASSVQAGGSVNTHVVPIPANCDSVGMLVFTQGLILGGGPELCNAIDVTLGF